MRTALLVAALALTACGTRGTLFTQSLQALSPISTDGALVTVVPTTNRAVIIRPGQAQPSTLRLAAGARAAVRVPNAEALIVLGGTARAPTLDLVDLEAGAVETLALPGFFDRVAFSEDGLFAVLTYDANAATGPLVARNLNEVGLLHVPSRTVSRLQLDTESLAPRGVVFGPVESNRRLVAVTLERGVALFDALRPEVAVRRITIRPPGSSSESSVLEAVFSLDAKWLFLRASALDDVIAIELGSEVGAPPSASINFVSGGQGLSDLEPAPDGLPDAVLAAYSTSRELFLLDARGIQDKARRFATTERITALTRLSGTRVLGWDANGGRGVVAWDLTDGRSGTSVLDGNTAATTLVPNLGKALFFHEYTTSGGASLSTVTVVEETNRLRLRLQSIQLSAPAQSSAVDRSGNRLFFTVRNSKSVVAVDLATLRLAELPLDTVPTTLHYLSASDELAAVTVGPDRLGDATLWPAGSVERGEAVRFTDYFFTDDLDRVEAP
jgi:hypothetical protein